jgi:hypothetical protein
VDQVLLVVAGKSTTGERLELTLTRIDPSDGHDLGYGTGTLPLEGGLPAQWEALIQPVLARDQPRVAGPVRRNGSAWTQQHTGYVLLATGATLLGGGAYCGLQALGEHSLYQQTPQTDVSTAGLHSSRGKTFALLADISVLAGLLAAVPGARFAFFAPEEMTRAPEPFAASTPSPPRAVRAVSPEARPPDKAPPIPAAAMPSPRAIVPTPPAPAPQDAKRSPGEALPKRAPEQQRVPNNDDDLWNE